MTDRPDWTIRDSEVLVSDLPYMHLRRDLVEHDGDTHHYYVVEQGPWVQACAITDDEQIVLVRQYRHGIGRSSLEVPGGYAEPGEDPAEAARRELLEETGFGGGVWTPLITLAPNPALLNNWLHCFVGEGVSRMADPSPDETERLEVEMHPLADLESLVGEQVIHALHAVTLLTLARRFR